MNEHQSLNICYQEAWPVKLCFHYDAMNMMNCAMLCIITYLRRALKCLLSCRFTVVGTTAEEVIAGVQRVTQRRVYGRFFHTYPRRWLCVCQWLSDWIKRGAVPMLTLNLQKAVPSGYAVPDAWHHQMVFGVSQQGAHVRCFRRRMSLATESKHIDM